MQYLNFMHAVFTILVLSACCSPYTQSFCCKPMECEQAKVGFTKYNPIINALNIYKENNGEYPSSLKKLQPQYIESIVEGVNDKPTYTLNKNEFELSFTYYGPGANICSYSSEISKWDCSGYF